MDKITITEWQVGLRIEIESFIRNWIDNQKINPELYPKKLSTGEWDELFYAFDQNKKDKDNG